MRALTAVAICATLASPAIAQQVPELKNGGEKHEKTQKMEFPPQVQVGIPVQPLSKRQQKAVRIARKRINDELMPTQGPDGSVSYVYGHTIPDLVCSPGNWCTIQLERGEFVVGPEGKPDANVYITDKVNWWFYLSARGDRKAMYTDVLVSPKYSGTRASLSLATNKGRRYTINLRSTESQWMPLMTFTYPDDEMRLANAAYTRAVGSAAPQASTSIAAGGVDISRLDSAFNIDGDESFRPAAVYTDGIRTVVDFGRVLDDMPVLVGIANDGGIFTDPSRYTLNVNVIDSGSKLLVDGVFDKAALVAGVGSDQREVLIERRRR